MKTSRLRNPRVVRAIEDEVWCVTPNKLREIVHVASRLIDDPAAAMPHAMEDSDVLYLDRAAAGPPYQMAGSTAIIPVMGTISKRMGMLSEFSGGMSIERFTQAFRAALSDSSVTNIVLQIDSPGGSIYGVQEVAQEIYDARGQKNLFAIADDLAASAAYWIGSAVSELWVTPSGEVGSIGVVMMHVDYSKAMEAGGVKVTYVHAGDNKVEGNPYQALGEEALSFMQQRVGEYYDKFISAVSRGRNTTSANVNKNFGQGRVFGAEQAKSLGMVDRIGTIDDLMARMPSRKRRSANAEADIAIATALAS